VYGNALLEAVSQDKHGGPPRLVIAKSALEKLREHFAFYGFQQHAPQYAYVLEDPEDGQVFLNYLYPAFRFFWEAGVDLDLIASHKQAVEKALASAADPTVREKYEWVGRYHNFVCRDFANSHPVPSDPYADPERAAACEQAQGLLSLLIDIPPRRDPKHLDLPARASAPR
jgi:hypothetical protein